MTREEAIEVILRNIRRGRTYRQEAGFIVDALLSAGFRYVGPDELDAPLPRHNITGNDGFGTEAWEKK